MSSPLSKLDDAAFGRAEQRAYNYFFGALLLTLAMVAAGIWIDWRWLATSLLGVALTVWLGFTISLVIEEKDRRERAAR